MKWKLPHIHVQSRKIALDRIGYGVEIRRATKSEELTIWRLNIYWRKQQYVWTYFISRGSSS